MSTKQKKKTNYQKEYLEVRRERYHTDAQHREKIKERERENNRRRRLESGKPVNEKSFGCYAGQASLFASEYLVGGRKVRGLNVKEMAGFLDMSESGLRAWIRREAFPQPEEHAGGNVYIYRIAHANKLATLILNGLDGFATLRADTHEHLIQQLHAASN